MCASYYACIRGIASRMICSEGLLYNPAKKACDFAERVTCAVWLSEVIGDFRFSLIVFLFIHSYQSVNKAIQLLIVLWPVSQNYRMTKIAANFTFALMANHRNIAVQRVRFIIPKINVVIVRNEQNVLLNKVIHLWKWNTLKKKRKKYLFFVNEKIIE